MNFVKMRRGLVNPIASLDYLRMFLRGYYYKLKYRLINRNVQIGKNFKVIRKFSILRTEG
jgi:hypothetical protein